ncbi:adaptor protein MecA [Lacticaseibacillus parakribbianus]|uniref:adaptor protein MecA n=1 Tax=Lacticaseibacillus parakribbianus TaxID=2970927 RepID=UPI0021CB77F6|nr:adaptor protein MecA [Lacticaseibacillus parakribbianus]
MEMERINDNTIRVLLGNEDLAERGITVLDLLGNHKQIENFFYGILDEVDQDHSFSTDAAVTFQVMPSQSGLELLISRSQQDADDDGADDQTEDAPDTDIGVPDFIRSQLNQLDTADEDASDEGSYISVNDEGKEELVLELGDFEAFIGLAQALRLEGASSDLYSYNHHYYLVLTFYPNHVTPEDAKDQIAVALEYGDKVAISSAVLSEYGELLMPTSALETGRYYFK